ncbi:MAG TPA: hypothetical protein VGJ93_04200 [Desulfuromonadaceae bacterium]
MAGTCPDRGAEQGVVEHHEQQQGVSRLSAPQPDQGIKNPVLTATADATAGPLPLRRAPLLLRQARVSFASRLSQG